MPTSADSIRYVRNIGTTVEMPLRNVDLKNVL